MKKYLVFVLAIAAVSFLSADVLAHDHPGCTKGKAAQKASDKSDCSKSCTKGDVKKVADKGCCGSCGGAKAAQKASDKTGCSKPCGEGDMKKVADKSGCSKPCGKGDMQKVAGKSGCSKSCGKGDMKMASGKCGKSMATCMKSCAWKPGCCESLAKMVPTMTYKVGDKTTQCSQEAKQMASHCSSMKVQYVVMDKAYDNQGEAAKAMTQAMNDLVTELTTVKMMVGDESYGCSHAAKQKAESTDAKVQYVVLRQKFDCKDSAMAAAKRAHEAVEKVSMSYVVDGKPAHCSKMASKCSKDGKKVEYCVGENKTCCPTEADMMVARAKLMTLIESIEQGQRSASL
jgi:hypothetical protein